MRLFCPAKVSIADLTCFSTTAKKRSDFGPVSTALMIASAVKTSFAITAPYSLATSFWRLRKSPYAFVQRVAGLLTFSQC